MRRMLFGAVVLAAAGAFLVAAGRALAGRDEKAMMRIGPLQIKAGVDEAGFVQTLRKFEEKRKLPASSAKEAHLLFATFDRNNDGRISSEEHASGLSAAQQQEAGGRRGCSPSPGPGLPGGGCAYNTCDCDTIDMPAAPQGAGAPQSSEGASSGFSENGQWCGGDCHCHCNTFLCARNGT